MRILLSVYLIFSITQFFGQKKVIDHTAYNDWKKNENQIVSNNGQYISYEISPLRGDGYLFLYNTKTEHLDSFPRGKEAKFSFESNYFVFKITPGFDTLRNCELNEIDKKKWPKDSLGILILANDSLRKIPLIKSFTVETENNWMTYTQDKNEFDKVESKKKKKKKKKEPEYKTDGKLLTVLDPTFSKNYQYKNVTEFLVSEKGNNLAYIEHKKEKTDSFQIISVNLKSELSSPISLKFTSIKNLTFNKNGDLLGYHSSSDTSKVKVYDLKLHEYETRANKVVADSTTASIPKGDAVSENRKPMFTEDGRFLYFGVAEKPKNEEKDSLLASEKVELDLWHYQDTRLQSQQLVELKKDSKKTDLYVYHLLDGKVVQLSNDTLIIRPHEKQFGGTLTATSNEQYLLQSQWEGSNFEDHYLISLIDGTSSLVKRAVGYDGSFSPRHTYYTYFDEVKSEYFLIDLTSNIERCITCSVKNINWQSDVNGMPMIAEPLGIKGYSSNENEIFVQSEFDVWKYTIDQNKLICLTNKEGQDRKIKLEFMQWSYDSVFVDYENIYLKGFDENTKGTHIFNFIDHGDHIDLVEKYYTDHKISFLNRSKNKETVIFRNMSLIDFPELHFTKNWFETEKTISITNPQQVDYNWATVELVNWKSYNGIPLEGLLYKPENYDPSKKYPLLIYYYELYSDNLHNHYVPKPTASVIFPTEYASAGYLVFMPDIRYKPGHPANSAFDCIMSGTDHLLKTISSIDSTKMGLQGQSWGGYQTAQLITMTNRYAAAMAGAPVSNMFSAYGGIRWGSGVNRQFQYEKTQSRIGKTIWEAPELYMENSPLFHIPKISTPLLIMSNDKDGAVPWYQGIEMFTGMKRLGKPCWLLNYNGDDHNLLKNSNKFDLSIRMRQFFDYYLLDKPAPKWMIDGIPATVKGKELRYE